MKKTLVEKKNIDFFFFFNLSRLYGLNCTSRIHVWASGAARAGGTGETHLFFSLQC